MKKYININKSDFFFILFYYLEYKNQKSNLIKIS